MEKLCDLESLTAEPFKLDLDAKKENRKFETGQRKMSNLLAFTLDKQKLSSKIDILCEKIFTKHLRSFVTGRNVNFTALAWNIDLHDLLVNCRLCCDEGHRKL